MERACGARFGRGTIPGRDRRRRDLQRRCGAAFSPYLREKMKAVRGL